MNSTYTNVILSRSIRDKSSSAPRTPISTTLR